MLNTTIELRERDDRHVQFFGERLQAARDLGDFGGTVLLIARHLHQLQIVDNDEVQAMFSVHTTSARTQFGRGQTRRFVDEDTRLGELPSRSGDTRPIIVGDLSAADVLQAHSTHR